MNKTTAKHNFIIYAVDGALFSIALVFISYESVLPVLLSRLGASSIAISLIPVLTAMGTNIPGIFMARKSQVLKSRKKFVIKWGLGQRFPWLFVGILLPVLYAEHSNWLIPIILSAVLIVMLSAGLLFPAYYDLISITVPHNRRGVLTSLRSGTSYILGILCGFASREILREVIFPMNFAILYLIGSLVFVLNLIVFSRVIEPEDDRQNIVPSSMPILEEAWSILVREKSFRWYVISRSLLTLSYSTCAFFPVYLVKRFSLGDEASGMFVIISAVTFIFINPVLGWMGDRFGYKLVLALTGGTLLLASLLGEFGLSYHLMLGLIVFSAMGRTGNLLMNNMAIEYALPGFVPVYIGVTGLIVGIISPLGIVAGVLVEQRGFPALFCMTGIMALLSLLATVLLVTEPRKIIFDRRMKK
jgi:MFS family permease